jgi:DNA transformation protein
MLPKKDDSFKDFILDQLYGLEGVAARAMFGGYGLYREGTFFGIVFRGRLFFKTDTSTQASYRERGMKPFRPNAKQTLKNYYEVPVEIIEEPDQFVAWARDAIRCCRLHRIPREELRLP